jgi:hypothetical protein
VYQWALPCSKEDIVLTLYMHSYLQINISTIKENPEMKIDPITLILKDPQKMNCRKMELH